MILVMILQYDKDKPEANCSKDLEQYCHTSSLYNSYVLSADEPTAIQTPEDLRLFKKADVRKGF